MIGRVTVLWRYPIKSMLGEELDGVSVDARGIVGDRLWAVRTAEGKLGSGKSSRRFGRVDGLLGFRAAYDGDTPVITLPSGATLRGDASDVDARLSETAGQPLSLVRERDVSHLDSSPVHVLTTSSLRWLAARIDQTSADARRFRPNVVLETSGDELLEEAWLGRTLRCGDVDLRITKRTERCVMTTLAQDGLVADPSVLRTLANANEACLGVYAEVLRSGAIRLGDVAEIS